MRLAAAWSLHVSVLLGLTKDVAAEFGAQSHLIEQAGPELELLRPVFYPRRGGAICYSKTRTLARGRAAWKPYLQHASGLRTAGWPVRQCK